MKIPKFLPRKKILLILSVILQFSVMASLPAQQITFREFLVPSGSTVHQTTDNGYIVCGNNLHKTDAFGKLKWGKNYGSTASNGVPTYFYSVQQTSDSGYIAAGKKGDASNGFWEDVLLIKTDSVGNVMWSKTYGGSSHDVAYSVQQTSDGGYIAAGYAGSAGSGYDAYLIKTDSNGNLLWTKTFGGLSTDDCYDVKQTKDGGYILAGNTSSFGAGWDDVYVIRTNPNGDTLWTRTFGSSGMDGSYSVWQNTDSSFAVTGYRNSTSFGKDVFLLQIGDNGNLLWSKTYGTNDDEEGRCVQQTSDGGFVITGGVNKICLYIIKTNFNGDTLWTRRYNENIIFCGNSGCSARFTGNFIQQTSDNGYVVLGNSSSSGYKSSYLWLMLLKTDSIGFIYCYQHIRGLTVSAPKTQIGWGGDVGSGGTIANYIPVITGVSGSFYSAPCPPPPSILTANVTSININCNGQCTGTATSNPSNGTAPYTYSWNTAPVQTTQVATGLCTGTYTVTVTDSVLSTTTAAVTITQPAPITTSVSSTADICGQNNGSATVSASGGVPEYTYSWNSGGQTTQTATGLSTGTYTVTITDANDCTTIDTVTVVSAGSVTATTTSSTICTGQNATLTASGGTNYSWNTGATTSSITPTLTSISTFTVIVSSGTCSDTAFATVTVNAAPIISLSGNTSLCTGDITTLTASGGSAYSWNTGATTTAITLNPSSTTAYSVIATDTSGCSDTANITVTVSPPPVANISGTDTICEGDNVFLTASGGGNYSWNTGATTSSITVSATASVTYSVIVSIGSCSDTAFHTVNVLPNPTANVGVNITITQGQTTTLSAAGGGTYSWNNGAADTLITVSPTITTNYCVIVTAPNNCRDTACVTVYVKVEPMDCSSAGEFFLPNAFSPNDDGENDVLKIYYGDMRCIETFNLVIYNRWGEKVFETTVPAAEWDGSFRGKIENTAVFVYYMEVTLQNGNEIVRKGNVSLMR